MAFTQDYKYEDFDTYKVETEVNTTPSTTNPASQQYWIPDPTKPPGEAAIVNPNYDDTVSPSSATVTVSFIAPYGQLKLNMIDVVYFEKFFNQETQTFESDKLLVYTRSGGVLNIYSTVSNFESKLPPNTTP